MDRPKRVLFPQYHGGLAWAAGKRNWEVTGSRGHEAGGSRRKEVLPGIEPGRAKHADI